MDLYTKVLPASYQLDWIRGCNLWLRSDLGTPTVIGANVNTWPDQSGSGHDATVGVLSPPHVSATSYNGRRAISGVNGTKGLFCSTLPPLGTTGSIVFVFSPATTAFSYLMGDVSQGNGILENFVLTRLEYFLASGVERDTISAAPTAGAHQVIVSQVDGVSLKIWYDGALVVNKVPAATINVAWAELFGVGSGANGTDGDIMEVAQIPGVAMNAAQAAEAHAYSQAYWGSP